MAESNHVPEMLNPVLYDISKLMYNNLKKTKEENAEAISKNDYVVYFEDIVEDSSALSKIYAKCVRGVSFGTPFEEIFQQDFSFDALYSCFAPLQQFCNGKDKIMGRNLGAAVLSNICRCHNMATRNNVIYYRETNRDQSFIITAKGISVYEDGKLQDVEWKKLGSVNWDSRESIFVFLDDLDEPLFNVSGYSIFKFDAGDSSGELLSKLLTCVAGAFEDTSWALLDQLSQLIEKEEYEDAVKLCDVLLEQDPEYAWLYHLRKTKCYIMLASSLGRKKVEEELELTEELLNELSGIDDHLSDFYFLKGLFLSQGDDVISTRNAFILAMDTNSRDKYKEIKEAYDQSMKENRSFWENYLDTVPYAQRKLLLPVKEIKGCVAEGINTFLLNELPKGLVFPAGHPSVNELYIGHPYNKSVYVPYSTHEYSFFLDKIDELCYVLQCLGATEISITSVKGRTLSEVSSGTDSYSGEGSIKLFSSSVSKKNDSSLENRNSSKQEVTQTQKFEPTARPYLPEGLVWYGFEPQWQRLVNQRLNGNMLEYHQVLSTNDTSFISAAEQKSIEASVNNLMSKISGDFSQSLSLSQDKSIETQWRVDVVFRPMQDFPEVENVQTQTPSPIIAGQSNLSPEEQKYLEEFSFIIEDGVISDSERKLLERIRIKLGISAEKAAEIEASCSSVQNDEQEYRSIVEELLDLPEAKRRRILDRQAAALGISPERAFEIENEFKQ